jgi:hypothetical protein
MVAGASSLGLALYRRAGGWRQGWAGGGNRWQASKRFFFGKKTKKLLLLRALALSQRAPQRIKIFASFFKKKRFLPVLPATTAPRYH